MLETIWLHIGAEKTGTTTIQRSLEASRDALIEHGVLFPSAFGQFNHTHLAAYAMDDGRGIEEFRIQAGLSNVSDLPTFRKKLAENIKVEIDKSGCHTMILSNEHCSSRLTRPSEIIRLKHFLYNICKDIRIVFYIRRPEDFLASWYSTSVASGNYNEFPWPVSQSLIQAVDWFSIADRWQKVFSRNSIYVRRLDDKKMVNGRLLDDFYSALGLENIKYVNPKRWNESLSLEAIIFLRKINKHIPYIKDDKINLERGNITEILGKWRGGTSFKLSRTEVTEIMNELNDSYKLLLQSYFPEETEIFSENNLPPEESCRCQELSVSQCMKLTSFIWSMREKEIYIGS